MLLPDDTIPSLYRRIARGFGETFWDEGARLLRDPGRPGKHLTRDSLYFARVLLDLRDEVQSARAAGIVDAVLDTQVTREGSEHCGNFPWGAEDGEAGTWDPNWACFNAATLLELLVWHRTRLPDATVARAERALALCAEHDLARWVAPAYTNIALLSSLCLAGAGEVLRNRDFAEAGREKLRETDACVATTGAFDEYNSPTYTAVNLRALAGILAFVKDGEVLGVAEKLRRFQWEELLDRVHLPTGQLAGPHGRAYGRDMLRDTRGHVKWYLFRALGEAFPVGVEADATPSDLFPGLILLDPDCPEDLLHAWRRRRLPRSVSMITDSCSRSVPLPESRRFPPLWRSRAGREAWKTLVESKGAPGTPGFLGQVQCATTHLAGLWCLGSASAEALGDQAQPLIAHWANADRPDRGNSFAALALREHGGKLERFGGAVLCCAQHGGRVLGLLRFGLDPEDRSAPSAARAVLAFQVNADANPEVVVHGGSRAMPLAPPPDVDETVPLHRGIVFKSNGVLCGVRVLQARVPGAKVSSALRDLAAPGAGAEGETGAHLILEPVELALGAEAYVAFAVEVCEETRSGGLAGLAGRLLAARVDADRSADGRVRLAWGSQLTLETSVRVLDIKGWLDPEGAVLT
ncbi:MAG: hypothetical protein AAB152_04040 [Candidatus Coatesbacteria bacterium]